MSYHRVALSADYQLINKVIGCVSCNAESAYRADVISGQYIEIQAISIIVCIDELKNLDFRTEYANSKIIRDNNTYLP